MAKEEKKNERVEEEREERELEDENGEVLPERKAMSVLGVDGGVAGAPGKLGPPLLDDPLISIDDPNT